MLKIIEGYNEDDLDKLERELKAIPNKTRFFHRDKFVKMLNEALKTGKSPEIQSMDDCLTITVDDVREMFKRAVRIIEKGAINDPIPVPDFKENLPDVTINIEILEPPAEVKPEPVTTLELPIPQPVQVVDPSLNPIVQKIKVVSTSATIVQTLRQTTLPVNNAGTTIINNNLNIYLSRHNQQDDSSKNDTCCEASFCGSATLRLFTSCFDGCASFFKKCSDRQPEQIPQQQIQQQSVI